MTIDEAFQAASSLLDQRGQLLNGHLLRLVEGDKDLFRVIRERLIAEGIAEDRSGVGLVRVEVVTSLHRSEAASADIISRPDSDAITNEELLADCHVPLIQSPSNDWWLMKAGKVLGPMELKHVCNLCRSGEIESAAVIRHGDRGLWKPLESVPEIAAARRGTGSQSGSRSVMGAAVVSSAAAHQDREFNPDGESLFDREASSPKEQFVFPAKGWSIVNKPQRGLAGRSWNFAAGCVGGSERLSLLLIAIACATSFYYWWQLPPSNAVIFEEFAACRKTMQRLRDRRVGRADWSPMEDQYRPRIEAIVNRLKPYANERHPVQQSLYLAGKQGLLQMMDYASDSTYPEQVFEKQMAMAKQGK